MVSNSMETAKRRGRPAKPEADRLKKWGLPISDDQLARAQQAADAAGKPLAVFCREAIIQAAAATLGEPIPETQSSRATNRSAVAKMLDQAGI